MPVELPALRLLIAVPSPYEAVDVLGDVLVHMHCLWLHTLFVIQSKALVDWAAERVKKGLGRLAW